MKKPKHMLTGVNIAHYRLEPDELIDVAKRFKFGKENGGVFTCYPLRVDQTRPTSEQLYEWAAYFRDNGVYFNIKNNYPRVGKPTMILTKEENEKIQEIAGEYYLGEQIGEFGGWYSSKAKGYSSVKCSENPVQGLKDCREAKETYIRQLRKIIDAMRENGTKSILATQAVTLLPYDFEAGVDIANVELAPRNMEQIAFFGRGANRAHKNGLLGAWFAHEFYGGYHAFDPLKAKRFTAGYYFMYLAGFDFVCLESGVRLTRHHLSEILPEDHPFTLSYTKEASDFASFCNSDERPGEDGPITKIAFVHGNLDGFAYGNSSSLWGQYHDKKWGFSSPEFSYKILDEVYRSEEWNNARNFGDYDYSHSPAYGQYDVVPATAPAEALRRYDWIIFCGWNTMTPEIYETFKEYVRGGGKLLITAAHMRDSIERDKKGEFVKADFEEFLGVKLENKIFNSNDGFKFAKYSTIDGVMYPGTETLKCDPAWSMGYTNYVKIEPTTATPVCFLSDNFELPPIKEGWVAEDGDMTLVPIVTEHKYGDGSVIFMANSEYPGAPEIYPLYKMMVKAVLSASHRTCELKVIGSDKIRFAMYEGDDAYKLYIFNTDFNLEQRVRVIFRGETVELTVGSVKLEILHFKK